MNMMVGEIVFPHFGRETVSSTKYCMADHDDTTDIDNLPAIPPHLEITEPLSGNWGGQKRLVRDIGARMRQLAGLKPGSVSIRTPEMVAEILDRLRSGETLLSVTSDPHIAGHSTIYQWIDADPALGEAIENARAVGAQILFDARLDIALGGAFSTGDRLRDELAARVIGDTAAKRNRAAFGEKVTVDAQIGIAPVILPSIALPAIPDAEFTEIDEQKSK